MIAGAAWALGTRAGLAIGLGSMAASMTANGVDLYPFGSALSAWNYAMRIVAVLLIVGLIGSIRRAHDREWLQSRSDRLTGLLNRDGFFDRLARRQARDEWSLFAYLDLDDFKQVNDRHGHAAGDALLRDFAVAVSGRIGPEALFARVGGDEFLLFLPAGGESEALESARRLHAEIHSALDGGSLRCSIGALIRGPECAPAGDRDIQLADRLMYEAKNNGSGLSIGSHAPRIHALVRDESPRALAA
jgi:diguanylate cyclase (GGDEF)-like protein